MERLYIVIILAFFMIIPIWFIGYSIRRCIRHWHDGIDRTQTITKNLVIKYICNISSAIFNLIHVFYIVPCDIYEIDEKTARIIFFTCLGISWLFSLYLVNFEHRRRLLTTWYGLRSFWPINMLLQMCFTIFILLDPRENSEMLQEWKIASFVMGWCASTILSLYSFFKPNEFTVIYLEPLLFQTHNNNIAGRQNSKRRSVIALEELETKLITTSIKECKVKTEKNRQVVYYHIIVTVGNDTHTVRKTYPDFECLHNSLREKFPKTEYPNLEFPKFPMTMSGSAKIDERKHALDEYLGNLCFPEFMIDDFLNFLHIEGQGRTTCIEAHKKIMGEERRPSIISDTIASNHGSFAAYYFSPRDFLKDDAEQRKLNNYQLQSYINLRIVKWVEEKEHIEYIIQWKAVKLAGEGVVMKRYSEIWDLHRRLRKILAPAGLPSFPKKNYMQTLRKKDNEAIDIRKIELENYLGHILNDPAYICQELLDFIECKLTIESLWKCNNTEWSYLLYTPISWDNELDKDSHFIIYTLKFGKFEKSKKIDEWTVKRRYKDFDQLNNFLIKRSSSPMLNNYLNVRNNWKLIKQTESTFPVLPGKSLTPLSSPKEIDNRRQGLEAFLEGLLTIPSVIDAFEFKSFINDCEG
ncbi:unnamed protein product [Blepharisma stoltei]|uniref:PX domain-containing protein n=1 Tax=Blepharisma stoltei TaxID=1481888 RepID=A0AAU9IWM0_9CILI|nr:unnamed protein product [Blepharisma stoltei]